MSTAPTSRPALLWFGLFGAPVAWAAMMAAGVGLTLADCNPGGERWGLPTEALLIVDTAVATAIAVASLGAAVAVFGATRDAPEQPPAGRVHFLATIAVAVAPLFVCIILMSGLGTILLDRCQQG